jgi:hypothetical protein
MSRIPNNSPVTPAMLSTFLLGGRRRALLALHSHSSRSSTVKSYRIDRPFVRESLRGSVADAGGARLTSASTFESPTRCRTKGVVAQVGAARNKILCYTLITAGEISFMHKEQRCCMSVYQVADKGGGRGRSQWLPLKHTASTRSRHYLYLRVQSTEVH